jgi:hypothetical protein
MYVLGLSSSWGTSRICPAWSPSEHQLTPALSPIWGCVRSHTVRRRLFIVLMTAAHISPNVFSLRNFLSNVHVLFLIIHSISFILIIHHIQTSNRILLFTWQIHSLISSALHSRPAALGLSCPIHLILIILFPSTLLVGRVVMKYFEGEISREKKFSEDNM